MQRAKIKNLNQLQIVLHLNQILSKEEYCDAVNAIKNYIAEGDVMQVVLAQDFSANFDKDPFNLYKAIRELNPFSLHVFFRFR